MTAQNRGVFDIAVILSVCVEQENVPVVLSVVCHLLCR